MEPIEFKTSSGTTLVFKPMQDVPMRTVVEITSTSDETVKAYKMILSCLVNPADSKHIEEMPVSEFSELVEHWSSMSNGSLI